MLNSQRLTVDGRFYEIDTEGSKYENSGVVKTIVRENGQVIMHGFLPTALVDAFITDLQKVADDSRQEDAITHVGKASMGAVHIKDLIATDNITFKPADGFSNKQSVSYDRLNVHAMATIEREHGNTVQIISLMFWGDLAREMLDQITPGTKFAVDARIVAYTGAVKYNGEFLKDGHEQPILTQKVSFYVEGVYF
jgi:hypothetical protein